MKQTIILLLLWQFCTVLSVYALPFKELSTTAGLSNRRVLASIKDGDGYIWFATRMGIDRYNGESFTNYKLADSPDIPEEHPKGIFINGQNEIYAFSEHNIYNILTIKTASPSRTLRAFHEERPLTPLRLIPQDTFG